MKLTHPFLLLVFAFICGLSSCQSSDDIGADFLNDSDLLNADFTDSLKINATLSQSEPTDLGNAQSNSVFLLGALDDPLFGKSSAAMCMQFTLGTGQNNLNFDSIPMLDSVVLSLAYSNSSSSYGVTDESQSFSVFEITDSLVFSTADDESTGYFTDYVCNVDQKLGESTLLFSRDSIIVGVDSLAPSTGITIRLDDAFGERFLAASQETEDSTFFNIVTFLEFFKGLAIVPDENNTAIAPFNLLDSDTQLKFYYKAYLPDADTLSNRTKEFLVRAQIGTNSVLALNEFKHDYTGTAPEMILNDGGKITDLAYLQSMAGLELELEIPELYDLGQLIVNQAELEINNLLTSENNVDSLYFPQPALIGFQILDADGVELFDGAGQVIVATDTIDNVPYRMNRYNIPLTLSTQRLLEEGKGNSQIIIKLVETPLNPFRLVVNGPEAELFPMKFRLFYTKID